MYAIPAVEAGSSFRLGRCYNVDKAETGPDIFNPDSIKSQQKNNIYFEYKQVRQICMCLLQLKVFTL